MAIAQRGTSSTSSGYQTVDRFEIGYSVTNESPTQAQVDVASGTTPYSLGFRKALKITNGNQTSGAGASNRVTIQYKIESQDIANSGWNYLSSSSFITLSYWVKSSVAQNFYNRLKNSDGTSQAFVIETGSLSADTWTKVTKTIPGNSNLTFNNDNGEGLEITWEIFRGTDQTGTRPLNAWAEADNNTRTPNQTSTWYITNDATFEITGVQLEVGSQATAFEQRSFGEELALCYRYYELIAERDEGSNAKENNIGLFWGDGTTSFTQIPFKVKKRTQPTLDISNYSNAFRHYGVSGGANASTLSINSIHRDGMLLQATANAGSVGFTRVFVNGSDGLKALVAASSEI